MVIANYCVHLKALKRRALVFSRFMNMHEAQSFNRFVFFWNSAQHELSVALEVP